MLPAFRRPWHLLPRWTMLIVLLALGLGGCATRSGEDSHAGADALLALPPDGAWLHDGQLVLSYSRGKDEVYLAATWPVEHPEPGRHDYRMALLEPSAVPPAEPAEIKHDWQPVRLYEQDRWQAMVKTLLLQLAAADPAVGTLVTVQGIDLVVHRDREGALRIVRFEDKPAALRVGQRFSEDDFSARADEYLRARFGAEGQPAGPVMFAIGDDELGGAFVLFDFERHQSVFIARPARPLQPGEKLGFTLQMIDALTLRSHLLAAVRQPVTLVNRLFWLGTHSLVVMLPASIAPRGEDPGPPVAREGMDLAAWEERLDELVGNEGYRGSMVPLIDGEAFFVSLVQAIQDAEESIDIRLYIFDTDDYALRIADLLKRRSRDVRIRVLIDRFGSMGASRVPSKSPYQLHGKPPLSIAEYLRSDSDISVRVVDNPWLTSDHTKVIVVDRRKAYVGGMNVGREYRYEWHDMMVEVEGPIVGRLQKDFDKRWAHTGIGGDLAFAIASMEPESQTGDAERPDFMDIRPLYTRSGDPQILRAQLAAIRQAQSRIWIQHPYVTEDLIIAELIQARRRGVDVRVILPRRSDSAFMNSANLLAARAFLNNGIRVYIYPGMTHVKAALYDGWAIVGSANFDKLSLRINQETSLATSDPRFVDRIARDLFEADFARSSEWTERNPLGWSDYLANFFADQL